MDGTAGKDAICVLSNASVILSSPDDIEKLCSWLERSSWFICVKEKERFIHAVYAQPDMTCFKSMLALIPHKHVLQTMRFTTPYLSYFAS